MSSPLTLETLRSYYKLANGVQQINTLVAFHLKNYIITMTVSTLKAQRTEGKDVSELTSEAQTWFQDLEALKGAIGPQVQNFDMGRSMFADYALGLFKRANDQYQTGKYFPQLADDFATASLMFDAYAIFKSPNQEIESRKPQAKAALETVTKSLQGKASVANPYASNQQYQSTVIPEVKGNYKEDKNSGNIAGFQAAESVFISKSELDQKKSALQNQNQNQQQQQQSQTSKEPFSGFQAAESVFVSKKSIDQKQNLQQNQSQQYPQQQFPMQQNPNMGGNYPPNFSPYQMNPNFHQGGPYGGPYGGGGPYGQPMGGFQNPNFSQGGQMPPNQNFYQSSQMPQNQNQNFHQSTQNQNFHQSTQNQNQNFNQSTQNQNQNVQQSTQNQNQNQNFHQSTQMPQNQNQNLHQSIQIPQNQGNQGGQGDPSGGLPDFGKFSTTGLPDFGKFSTTGSQQANPYQQGPFNPLQSQSGHFNPIGQGPYNPNVSQQFNPSEQQQNLGQSQSQKNQQGQFNQNPYLSQQGNPQQNPFGGQNPYMQSQGMPDQKNPNQSQNFQGNQQDNFPGHGGQSNLPGAGPSNQGLQSQAKQSTAQGGNANPNKIQEEPPINPYQQANRSEVKPQDSASTRPSYNRGAASGKTVNLPSEKQAQLRELTMMAISELDYRNVNEAKADIIMALNIIKEMNL